MSKVKSKTNLKDLLKAMKDNKYSASIVILLDEEGGIRIGYDGLDDLDSARVLQISADLMSSTQASTSIH